MKDGLSAVSYRLLVCVSHLSGRVCDGLRGAAVWWFL